MKANDLPHCPVNDRIIQPFTRLKSLNISLGNVFAVWWFQNNIFNVETVMAIVFIKVEANNI